MRSRTFLNDRCEFLYLVSGLLFSPLGLRLRGFSLSFRASLWQNASELDVVLVARAVARSHSTCCRQTRAAPQCRVSGSDTIFLHGFEFRLRVASGCGQTRVVEKLVVSRLVAFDMFDPGSPQHQLWQRHRPWYFWSDKVLSRRVGLKSLFVLHPTFAEFIDARDEEGRSALYFACCNGHCESAEVLIEAARRRLKPKEVSAERDSPGGSEAS